MSLRLPPPIEQPLRVVRDGDRVELRDGDALVAEGAPAELLLDVPDADLAGRGGRGVARRAATTGAATTPSPPASSAGPTASPATGCACSRAS